MRYIQRIDNAHHTWKVALRRKNKAMHKYFPDTAYGGMPQALAAAIAWRNEIEAKYTTADYALWRREQVPPSNTTGIVGVYRGAVVKKRGGLLKKFYNWQGYWTSADGTRASRSFSINKYGEDQAKTLAIQARRQGMAQVAKELRGAGSKPAKAAKP